MPLLPVSRPDVEQGLSNAHQFVEANSSPVATEEIHTQTTSTQAMSES